jgi:hypothetical protein
MRMPRWQRQLFSALLRDVARTMVWNTGLERPLWMALVLRGSDCPKPAASAMRRKEREGL